MNNTTIAIIIMIIILLYLATKNNIGQEHMTYRDSNNNSTDNLNNIPTFVINLKDRPDRKIRAIEELNKHGINGTFIEGINGLDLSIPNINLNEIYTIDHSFRPLRRGEIGCYLSHIACWSLILESGKPYGMILEDDVVFVDNFRNIFNDTFEHIKDSEWDLIMIGRGCTAKQFSRYRECTEGKIIYDNTLYPKLVGYGAFAYIIKADTIRELLKRTFPIHKPVDTILLVDEKPNLKIIAFIKNLADVSSRIDSDTVGIK